MSEEKDLQVEEEEILEPEVIPDFILKEITSLEHDLMGMDRTYSKAEYRREKLISKIERVVDDMDISLGGDPEKLEAQSKMVDTYAKLLRDSEDNAYKRASIKLRKKQDETATDIHSCVAGILRNIDVREVGPMTTFNITPREREALIDSQFDSRGCVVVSELELGNNHTDVHKLSAQLREEADEAFLLREAKRTI